MDQFSDQDPTFLFVNFSHVKDVHRILNVRLTEYLDGRPVEFTQKDLSLWSDTLEMLVDKEIASVAEASNAFRPISRRFFDLEYLQAAASQLSKSPFTSSGTGSSAKSSSSFNAKVVLVELPAVAGMAGMADIADVADTPQVALENSEVADIAPKPTIRVGEHPLQLFRLSKRRS